MSTEKVTKQLAEADFDRFAEEMDIVAPGKDDGEIAAEYEGARAVIVREIVRGRMRVEDDGRLSFDPSEGETIIFNEPTGADFMAMDRKKAGQGFARTFAFLEAVTKEPAKRFANMKRRDLTPCAAVVSLFLA